MEQQVYKVGIGTSWPPYVMYRSEPYGIDIEITKLVFKEAGLCIDFVQLPSSARGITELQKGFIDILPSASYTKERAQIAFFSKPYRKEIMRLFTTKKHQANDTLHTLFSEGYTFAINPGAYYGEELKELRKITKFAEQIVEVPTLNRRFELITINRVDFTVEDDSAGRYKILTSGFQEIVPHSYIVHDNSIHFMLAKHAFSEAQLLKVNQAIEKISVTIAKVTEKYRRGSG